ncbi:6,7-dimethyl-8-ribityllumazine synthase [Luteolibacter sp. GHJ8]|uniref:6,7-dimethyl-8-ribityllumazine synthase n=1 Tax=Luteolibacter rhizosphaerae TaxID=2989719 RepID=A0ABT3FZ54_9BACT|nr:6,7-dimethyl-8-ribityllumazine synthase [Luteolibacter rhizosphaerae]MCW1912541.1 6,7-dimethyl-8-ribityllumazine synthase [Luteolibacter rhizosphaerae]
MNIALISASWHVDLLAGASGSCKNALAGHGTAEFTVPGALEIPLFAQTLARSGKYDAIIAFGLIVDGGIYRHEFVADAVISGMMRVQLDTGVPIFSCVLTPQHFDESEERLAYFRDHLVVKGGEVGKACLKMLSALNTISADSGPFSTGPFAKS